MCLINSVIGGVTPMSLYPSLDPIIDAWKRRHGLHVYTQYRDSEVRSANVVSRIGERFQIWLGVPEDGQISVHAWDYEKRKREWTVSTSQLDTALEDAMKTVKTWMRPVN
jgi:hypothetical protein